MKTKITLQSFNALPPDVAQTTNPNAKPNAPVKEGSHPHRQPQPTPESFREQLQRRATTPFVGRSPHPHGGINE